MSTQILEPVSINGHTFQPRDEIHRRKLEALRVFVEHLLQSPAREQIGKIILFGSVAWGMVNPESDVDVLIFGSQPLKRAEDASIDAALETRLALSESVEPLVYTLDAYFQPASDFEYQVTQKGQEVYSMDEAGLSHQAAETLYGLAVKYLAQAGHKYEPQDEAARRVAIDVAYNAAELCAKGMLRLLTSQLPKTHSGIITLFSDKYVKTKLVSIGLGRDFQVALNYRNKARYDGNAIIVTEMVDEVFRLADQMVNLLEQTLTKHSS